MRMRRRLAAVAILGSCCGFTPAAADAAEIADTIRAARERFTPVGEEQLADARAELRGRARELERFVRPQSENGRRWLRYLRWDSFQEQLAADQASDFDPLVDTYQQLNRDESGLELPRFRRVADALRRLIDLAAVARQENQADVYAQQLDALASDLERYDEQPSAELRSTIGRRLDFISGLGQAPEVVAAVRERYARPNALVQVSAEFLDAAADPIDRREPVTDCILGTSIRSDAHTLGTSTLQTVPADDVARLSISSAGRVNSRNVGRKGPAVIRSTSETDFTAFTMVELSDAAFRSLPVDVNATTHSNIHSISKQGGGFGSKFVSKIGWKKARQSKSRAEAIAADHAEVRIARRVADETTDKLHEAWQRYQEEYRHPLVRRGELPEHIRYSSTEEALQVEVVQANRSQLAAPGDPPPPPGGRDMVLRLHETAANNYSATMLSGVTIRETDPDEGTKADALLPDWIRDAWKERMDEKAEREPVADFEPWSLTFRRERPVTVAFVDDNVQLTIHVAHLESGDDKFDRWDVTGTFVPEMTDGGVTLRRQGDLVVLPTGFDPERGQLSSRQVAVRRNLTKVLTERSDEGRGFPQTVKIERLEPTGDFAKVGPLDVEEFVSDEGWLTVAWNRP